MTVDDLVTEARKAAREVVKKEAPQILQGTWLGAEAEDANLSQIEIEAQLVRWARKAEHITGLSVGDQVLCIKAPGLPVMIIAVIVGDITLANV